MTSRSASGISADAVPRPLGGNASAAPGLTPADWFVLSRTDGSTPVRMLRQLVGMGEADFDASLTRLVQAGLLAVPGFSAQAAASSKAPAPTELRAPAAGSAGAAAQAKPGAGGAPVDSRNRSPASEPSRPREETARPRAQAAEPARGASNASRGASAGADITALGAAAVPGGWPTPFERFTVDESRLQDGDALTREQKLVLLYFDEHLRKVTYYQLLGIPQSAGNDAIRAAYFRLSKVFHPDRWFRKDIGGFEHTMVSVFKWLNRAYLVLSSPKKRKGYDRLLQQGYLGEWQLEESESPRRNVQAQPNAAEATPRTAGAGPAPAAAEPTRSPDTARAVATMLMRARKAATDGDWRGAADAYLRAVQLQGTTELRILAVECMLKANAEPSSIEREVRAAAAQAAGDTRILILEAEVARRLGQPDRAARCYKDVLATEPSNPVARLGLERLGIAPE